MSGPGRPFELRRKPRRPGEGARLRGTGEPRTWAAAQWLALMETLVPPAERRAGLDAAKGGQVASLSLSGGLVEAGFRAAGAAPVRVRLEVATLGEAQWRVVVDAMAAEAFYLAKLLAREVPAAIDAILEPQGMTLLPAPHEVTVLCTCPAGGRCRHVAAALYLVAGLIDDDPLVAFELRGMQGDRILDRLTATRALQAQGAAAAHAEPVAPPASQESNRPLEECLDDFWRPGAQLAELQQMAPPHHAPHALLRRLGPSPLSGRFPLVGLLASVYDEVARHALHLRDRAEGIEEERVESRE